MRKKDLIIRKVTARPVTIPMKRPLMARHKFTHWVAVVVDIETEGEVRGHGYICPYLASGVAAHVELLKCLGKHMWGVLLHQLKSLTKVCVVF